MKKILLFATMLLALVIPAKAAEATFVMADIYADNAPKDGTATEWGDGISALTVKGGGNATVYNTSYKSLRLYYGAQLTIKSADAAMEKIVFTLSGNGKSKLPEITASTGTIATQAKGDETVVWTGNATEVTLNVSDYAVYGNKTTDRAQFCFTEVTVTLSEEGVAVATPAFSVASGAVLAGTEVEITCATEGASIYYTTDGTEPTNESTAYAGAITIDKDMTIKAIAYKGEDKSFVATASYNVKSVVSTVAALNELVAGTTFAYDGDLTVVYANGLYNYVTDGKDYSLLYKSNLGLNAGDVVKGGWEGSVTFYVGLFEVVPNTALVVEGTAAIPAPAEITAANVAELYVPANINGYYVVKDVTFADATSASKSNTTVKVGETSVVIRNNFQLESVEAGTYDVVGFISVYDSGKQETPTDISKLQFFPIEYKAAGTDGINGVEVDVNAPVKYYNLSGMPISNPAAGQVVIRVQGGKANKIHF